MAILPRFIESRKYAPSNDYWYNPFSMPTSAGVLVSEKEAMKYLTVFACVSLISGDLAKLPLNLYRKRKDGGKDLVTDHKLYDLLHNAPNPEMTSFNWREASQGHLLLWGNHYSYKETDKTGKLRALWPLPDPGQVQVKRRNDTLVYEYYVDGEKKIRTRDQIFHVPGYGFNGLVGMSMIGLAREAIGMGLAAETFGSRYFSEGTHPSGLLTMEQDLGESEAAYIAALKASYAGLGKSQSVMVLQNGEKYQPLTVPMEDAQFLETRDHQKIEICGMYHVPPHKVAIHGQNSNYNNLEQENSSYVDSCLMSWFVRWESAINLQLLSEQERRSGLFFEFLVAGLLRGDSQARAEFYNKIFQVGGISPNEIRSKENMNPDPAPEADMKYVMLNMVPLNKVMEVAVSQDEPKPPTPEEEKEEVKQFFRDADFRASAEKRSIQMRDRLARAYRPLILDAAKAIVSRETKAIKNRIASRAKGSDKDTMSDYLNDFYSKFPEYITQRIGPVLKSYLSAVAEESFLEIDAEITNLDKEINEYIDRYAERHTESSIGQMTALLEGKIEDLETRADEWMEKRPGKITDDEAVRASSAAYSWVVFGAGLSLIWRTRSGRSCEFCKELDGKRISRGQSFVSGGDEINPKGGDGPMRFFGTKKHPPLHKSCKCYVTSGV